MIELKKLKRGERLDMERTGPRTQATVPRPEGWSSDPHHYKDAKRWAEVIRRKE